MIQPGVPGSTRAPPDSRARRASSIGPWRLLLLLTLGEEPCHAIDLSDYLLVPTVTRGERELDWHSGAGSAGATIEAQTDSALGIGAGLSDHWFSEISVRYRQESRKGIGYASTEWENIFQLAEPDQWPVDVGLFASAEKLDESRDGALFLYGALLQKEFGLIQANFNMLLGNHAWGSESHAMSVHFQSQIKYRYSEPLEFGVQSFDEWGSSTQVLAPYRQQTHGIGPVVLGQFQFPHERAITYNAAFLLGTSAHSPDRTLRAQIEYEF